MIVRAMKLLGLAALLLALPVAAAEPSGLSPSDPSHPDPGASPADALRADLMQDSLATLVAEVLERSPRLAMSRARVAAAMARAPQVRSLPDPMASLGLFLLPPETRVGPQRLALSVSQQVPWFGKLALREQAALYTAAAAGADLEAERLKLLTETRRLAYELAFSAENARITAQERAHLLRHEEAATARYAAGSGLQQAVIKVQAEITRSEQRLLEIESRRRALQAELNALRDRPADAELELPALPEVAPLSLETGTLRALAADRRPELAAERARVAAAGTMVELARKSYFPDLTVGLGYTVVDRRQDLPGRLNPPPGNGDDILAVTGGVQLPLRRPRLAAALEEALQMQLAAEAGGRQAQAEIERQVGDPASRLPLLADQWHLFDQVLLAQAEESLRSAEAAYATGKIDALSMLNAEHVLFDVRRARARTQADYAIARAQLEGAIAGTLPAAAQEEQP